MRVPRVAIGGFGIECNRFAPVATRRDFEVDTWLWGEDLIRAVRGTPPRLVGELAGFCAAMDAAGPWGAVPLGLAWAHPNGPVKHAVFKDWLARAEAMLRDAGPVDGLFLQQHGAALTTEEEDPDGLVTARLRAAAPGARVVVTLDLHANLSRRMVASADVTIAYRTNPHVDMRARGEEAGRAMRGLLSGAIRPAKALVRLPIVPPTVAMLTDGPGPFAAMRRSAEAEMAAGMLNVSVLGSFPHADTADNGIAVLATAGDGDAGAALAAATRVARIGWEGRAAFDPSFTTLEQAVARAAERDRPRIALADLGDNPGGGGSGRETAILRGLLAAGVDGWVLGLLHDPALAAEAHERRARAAFDAVLGSDGPAPLPSPVRVIGLSDGRVTGRRGLLAGVPLDVGPSCALAVGGGVVAVSTHRYAPNDPALFEMLGLDLASFRTIIVKSRGHFRAGFDEFVRGEDVVEVASPGLTTPLLRGLPWTRLPRPVLPLDEGVEWTPPGPRGGVVA